MMIPRTEPTTSNRRWLEVDEAELASSTNFTVSFWREVLNLVSPSLRVQNGYRDLASNPVCRRLCWV